MARKIIVSKDGEISPIKGDDYAEFLFGHFNCLLASLYSKNPKLVITNLEEFCECLEDSLGCYE